MQLLKKCNAADLHCFTSIKQYICLYVCTYISLTSLKSDENYGLFSREKWSKLSNSYKISCKWIQVLHVFYCFLKYIFLTSPLRDYSPTYNSPLVIFILRGLLQISLNNWRLICNYTNGMKFFLFPCLHKYVLDRVFQNRYVFDHPIQSSDRWLE